MLCRESYLIWLLPLQLSKSLIILKTILLEIVILMNRLLYSLQMQKQYESHFLKQIFQNLIIYG